MFYVERPFVFANYSCCGLISDFFGYLKEKHLEEEVKDKFDHIGNKNYL